MPRDRVYSVELSGFGLNVIEGFMESYCNHGVIGVIIWD